MEQVPGEWFPLFSSAKSQNAFSSAFMHGIEGAKKTFSQRLALRSFMLQSQLVSNHRDEL
ncbi:hypothetical protein C5I45_07915 [Bacillus sp. ZY-1-1]|nr:hypothetical protein C5I45_07915 [Bacillus sp. ZY-1-1]